MARPVAIDKDKVLAEWKSGEHTVRSLADSHGVSASTVYNLVKDVPKTLEPLINKQIEIKQELAQHNKQENDVFNNVVDEKTRRLARLHDIAMQNVEAAMVEECSGQTDFCKRADTILKTKETVIGKGPETAVQVNVGGSVVDVLRQHNRLKTA